MSTDLVNLSLMDFEEVAALTGASLRETSTYLPRLKINREPEDDEGNSIPMGAFSVSQNDTVLYGKEATFRTFINAYQYQEYSPSDRKFVNTSIIIKSFNEQALDALGGVACGKLSKSSLETASDSEKARQKNIKCNRLMFGLLTLSNPKEEPVVTSLPVMFKLAGSNFMAPKGALDAITKLKHQYFQHSLSLSTKREKQGSNVYYSVQVSPDLKNEIRWQEDDLETFKMFQANIDRENKVVVGKWNAVKKSNVDALRDHDILHQLDLNDRIDDLFPSA